MQEIKDTFETILFFLLTVMLYFLFLVNLPLFQEPHGLLVMNELSGFSSGQLSAAALFGSAALCAMLGALMMKWLPDIHAGMASNLWATTFFLLWADSMFALSSQSRSYHYLILLGLGLLFLYLFFFTLHYLGFAPDPTPAAGEASWKPKLVVYWLVCWMGFCLMLSVRLLLNSSGYPEFQAPLAMGFCALCFLNYLLFLYIQKAKGGDVEPYSRIGRIAFSLWLVALLAMVIGKKFFH